MNKLQLVRRYFLELGYCAMLLLVVWLFLYAMVSRDYSQAVRDIEQNNDQLVLAYEEHVRRSLYGVEEQMLLIKSEYERSGVTPAVATMLERGRLNPLLLQIVLSPIFTSVLRPSSTTVTIFFPKTLTRTVSCARELNPKITKKQIRR